MEVSRVIVRQQVSKSYKMAGIAIISALNVEELAPLMDKKDRTLEDATQLAQILIQFDRAAKFMGFKNCQDMMDFAEIYGADALLA